MVRGIPTYSLEFCQGYIYIVFLLVLVAWGILLQNKGLEQLWWTERARTHLSRPSAATPLSLLHLFFEAAFNPQ